MNDPSGSLSPVEQRVIRVFVSSTFRDMQAEREILVKRIFPQLRKLCEKRGVTWGEVDLRWGVTDEQKAEGKVLPICLEEIHRCRPYFIGLLGERYGWISSEIPPALMEREPWLADHRNHSVTELEILHGVLRNPGMARHAFFYFRDPGFSETLIAERRTDFTSENPESARKLADLKDRIRRSGFPVRENYPDPKALGELVLKDLTRLINDLFPEEREIDPLARDAAEHEAFARSRSLVYIGRPQYFDRLDTHAASDDPPLVILGESGSGKSALLANWAIRRRTTHPHELVVVHFIGATPYSTNWGGMVQRILGEFKRGLGLDIGIPDSVDSLRAAFANALHMAAAKGRIILILDALNQLEDCDAAPHLVWLPPVSPQNVRLVVSTLPGQSLDELQKRGWPTLQVKALEPDERKQLIVQYLAQYTKSLGPNRIERVAAAPQSANPLYLRALLEELRMFGEHERLDELITRYLGSQTIPQLYEMILARYEEDYEEDRPGLVSEAMSLLWAARHGLSENEILDLLGADGQPLPRALWSPLYLAAESSIVNRSGLIDFSHAYFRSAVQELYLPSPADQAAAHLHLAAYFERRELTPRKIAELPWQLARAEAWSRLSVLLADLQFFEEAYGLNAADVASRWAELESHSFRKTDVYRNTIEHPETAPDIQCVDFLWALLITTGYHDEGLTLVSYLDDQYQRAGEYKRRSILLADKAWLLNVKGELDEAMTVLKDQERLSREIGDKAGLHYSLRNQAQIVTAHGELDRAMTLHKEEELICREIGDKSGLYRSLGYQAIIYRYQNNPEKAMSLHNEQEHLCREIGDLAGLSWCLRNQGIVLADRGDLNGAMRLYKEDERLCLALGYQVGLVGSILNQALILYATGQLDAALSLLKKQEELCRSLGYKNAIQESLGAQAMVLQAIGDLDGAMALGKEQECLCREMGDVLGLSRSLINQAILLSQKKGLPNEALPLAEEANRLVMTHGFTALANHTREVLENIRSLVK